MLTALVDNDASHGFVDLKSNVIANVREFTMMPAAALRAISIAQDPNAVLPEFVAAIETDLKLTTRIVSMANSTFFSTGTPVSDLPGAVLRLGFRQCQSVIIAACAAGFVKSLPLKEAQLRERLWAHGFVTGVICRHLNSVLEFGFQGEEFTAGLLHDLGRSLVAATSLLEFRLADDLNFNEDPGTPLRENALWRTNHCEIGACFASYAGLPEPLVGAIEHHHTPESAEAHHLLVAVVAAADHMANHIEMHGSREPYDAALNPYLQYLPDSDRACAALTGAPPLVDSVPDDARRMLVSA